MILQSLVTYYEALYTQGKIYPLGYCTAGVSFGLRIGWDGELIGIIPLKETIRQGKREKEVPQSMVVPNKEDRQSNVFPHFLCDHSGYLLGLDEKGNPKRTARYYIASQKLHNDILKEVDSKAARAIIAFFQRWKPEEAKNNPELQKYYAAITAPSTNLIFVLPDETYAHNDASVLAAWEKYLKEKESKVLMTCLITGRENQPIARLHGKIKGVKGAQSSGASIVSFNAKAFESYGRDEAQGLNAPISEYVAFAYVAALNQLLANEKHRRNIGDATVVYWAETGESQYLDMFADVLMPDEDGESRLHSIMDKLAQGKPLNESGIDLDTRFCVLALSPNAARLSVRFFWQDRFGNILNNIRDHYERLAIVKPSYAKPEYLTLKWLLREIVPPMPPEEKENPVSPLLAGAVLRSILMGTLYPEALAQSVMLRIRARQEISWGKAAILKAWLLKNPISTGKYKEVLTMSLNEESKNKAYVLGRLFAVLEKAQIEAIWGNRPSKKNTIRDRYFPSACAAPVTVFPVLLRLFNHHVTKANNGMFLALQVRKLMDKLDVDNQPFPSRLTLEEQGIFTLGYYHQEQALYKGKDPVGDEGGSIISNDEEITNMEEEE